MTGTVIRDAEPWQRLGISVQWNILGAELANACDHEQTAFFKGFVVALLRGCRSFGAAERQLAYVNDRLTNEERELLAMLGYREK